jgi:fumarate hydratase, class II
MSLHSPKWGPYTADALLNYPSGLGAMPPRVIHAFGRQKLASAKANARLQELPGTVAAAIAEAAQEVASGAHDDQFPLSLWQAGDGNQTHINVNEVIAIRAAELGGLMTIHPLDHVNRNQSSNDTWPTVVHIALTDVLRGGFTESLTLLAEELEAFAARHQDTQKVGRTFLRDAHNTTVGKEFGAFGALLRDGLSQLALTDTALLEVPQGAGAVGIGGAVHSDFAPLFIEELRSVTGRSFRAAPLPATSQVVDTALLRTSNLLVELAVVCMKLTRDIELLGSGPSCGIGELRLPATGPGSSSMAGKINPTHASMLEMICMKVLASHTMVCASLAGSRLQLNTTYVLAACSTLESVELLTQGMRLFATHLVARLEVNHQRLEVQVQAGPGSLFLRSRELGYDAIARTDR